MSSKGGTVLGLLALTVSMGALGYATWMNLKLQDSFSVLAETQNRNLKQMMISLAHTEGQLGRVKEAMNAFDLQKWLATVQGPLVDRLEEKMSAGQRVIVGEEVKKLVQAIISEQAGHWDAISKSLNEAKAEIEQETSATNALGKSFAASLANLKSDGEARSKARHEEIQSQFTLLIQHNKGVLEGLRQPDDERAARFQAQIEGIKKENERFTELLEQRGKVDQEFREKVMESLAGFADATAQQKIVTQEQLDQTEKRWQGLFLTLRENHEAELENDRNMLARLQEDRVRAREIVTKKKAVVQPKRQGATGKVTASEGGDERLEQLLKFCARRPESVLCRDLEEIR